MNTWGVFQLTTEGGERLATHIAPIVEIDGEGILSGFHTLSPECVCGPIADEVVPRTWTHHDPDQPGALSEAEWQQRKEAASR